MEPINFCYWLQGHFELSETKMLLRDQVDCALKHVDLVTEFCKERRLAVPSVITEIRTLLRIMDGDSAVRLTAEIKRALNDQFLHVIGGPARRTSQVE